jgi:hypothetical protein
MNLPECALALQYDACVDNKDTRNVHVLQASKPFG